MTTTSDSPVPALRATAQGSVTQCRKLDEQSQRSVALGPGEPLGVCIRFGGSPASPGPSCPHPGLPSGAVEHEGAFRPTAVVDEVVAEARSLEAAPGFPRGVIERIRGATAMLAVGESAPDNVRQAALLLHRQAEVPLEPAMGGRRQVDRLIKQVVGRLVGWYVRFLAHQIAALGQATARLGLAVAERTERLQAEDAAQRAEVERRLEDLSARVARMETQSGAGGDGGPAAGR